MADGKLVQFPMRNPDLFSREINYQILSTSEFNRILRAAIRGLAVCEEFGMPRRVRSLTLRSLAARRWRGMNPSESWPNITIRLTRFADRRTLRCHGERIPV